MAASSNSTPTLTVVLGHCSTSTLKVLFRIQHLGRSSVQCLGGLATCPASASGPPAMQLDGILQAGTDGQIGDEAINRINRGPAAAKNGQRAHFGIRL